MNLQQALLLLAVVVLLLLWLAAKRTSAKLRVNLAHLKTRRDEAERTEAALRADLADQQAKHEMERTASSRRLAAAENEARRLSKYQVVADADEKARELTSLAEATLQSARASAASIRSTAEAEKATILDEASQEVKKLRDDADAKVRELTYFADAALHNARISAASIQSTAEAEKATVLDEARQEARRLRDDARTTLDSATLQAATIVQAAEKRAQDIAGSAYEAMKNASLYEGTVQAMKNIIEGYGDRYVIPGRSLLDDLAEEFGHTQAGEELKKARERTTYMIRNGTAATCEYVGTDRGSTVTRFVLDAFNGKVDSTLSRIRHDNAGTLAQEIRDAANVVNFNGWAFGNARITPEYLASRLDELKWAATAQQLKLEEREEQRHIKEQLREEEKARREYERAIREATRDQEVLRKAMENAQQQIERATVEQKAKYEQQLEELTLKLKEAEERNQRAISMAEQTKRGWVYVISNVGAFGEHVYKIGLTRRLEPRERIGELGDSSVPFDFDVHALIFSEDAPALETRLHKHFAMMQLNKANYRKEFFRIDLQHLREEIDKLNLSVKWMASEAREYRETLAIEKEIASDPQKRKAWLGRQRQFRLTESKGLEPDEASI